MGYGIPSEHMIENQLSSLQQPQKPKILVVDDEPDNLDLLYRTFRRGFRVLRANSGVEALEILKEEGEVAVIISDQRMPEMKGTEFLSKTVPQFPNTVRIILTGFTDVEDLVDAINSGQVYKYITKPWDPDELQTVVSHAADTYQSLRGQRDDVNRAQLQTQLISDILTIVGQLDDPSDMLTKLARAVGEGFSVSSCALQSVENGTPSKSLGVYVSPSSASTEVKDFRIDDDPLSQRAIATQSIQIMTDLAKEDDLGEVSFYSKTDTQSQIAIPLMANDATFALLTLRWSVPLQAVGVQADDISLICLLSKQLALSLGY
ncbi:MAG: response regulator, partial [Leptolyngbyaceae bacterium]|nr:response regulator [Leptolyngbyaceae bacterium]